MISFFNITQQGQSHIDLGMPCQDYSKTVEIKLEMEDITTRYVVAAIADGVGSCKHSDIGSKIAVESSIYYISKHLQSEDEILTVIKSGFKYSLSNIKEYAVCNDMNYKDLDTTLTVSIYDGYNLWYGHIGDGGIVVIYADGQYEMVTSRHKGEEINTVVPLSNLLQAEYNKVEKGVISYVMMTDGVLDFCVDIAAMRNRVYFPFLEPALIGKMSSEDQVKHLKQEWEDYFNVPKDNKYAFRKRVSDDISFSVVQNTERIDELEDDCIVFDQDNWDKETEVRRKKLEEALYSDYRKYKEELDKQKKSL